MKRVSSIAPQPECQSALWLHRSDQQQFCSRSCRGEVPPGGRAWASGLPPRNRLLPLGLFEGLSSRVESDGATLSCPNRQGTESHTHTYCSTTIGTSHPPKCCATMSPNFCGQDKMCPYELLEGFAFLTFDGSSLKPGEQSIGMRSGKFGEARQES